MTFSFKSRLIASSALALTLISGYGRRSYAACTPTGGANYLCSGVNNDAGLQVNANNATVTTAPGFSAYDSSNTGLYITGNGSLSFTDLYMSSISGGIGLSVHVAGDDGGTAGSANIVTTGDINGAATTGIFVQNYGTGETLLDVSGDIDAVSAGINAQNASAATDLELTIGQDSVISTSSGSFNHAVALRNYGTGQTQLRHFGEITSSSVNVTMVGGANTTGLTVYTAEDSSMTSLYGNSLSVFNYGSGPTNITIDGDITAGNFSNAIYSRHTAADFDLYTGANSYLKGRVTIRNLGAGDTNAVFMGDISADHAVNLFNGASAEDMNIYTGADSVLTSTNGLTLQASHFGTGALTLNIKGDMNGSNGGLYASNQYGTDTVVNIFNSAAINITSGSAIQVTHSGTGSLEIHIDGDVTSNNSHTFYAMNKSGTGVVFTTGADSHLQGLNSNGAFIRNYAGAGGMDITLNGDISTLNTSAVLSNSGNGDMDIVVGASATFTSTLGSALQVNSFYSDTNLHIDGDLYAYGTAVYLTAVSSAGHTTVYTGADSRIVGEYFGSRIYHMASGGGLSWEHHGEISANTALLITNTGGASSGIVTDGIIEGTGGIAIKFAYNPYYVYHSPYGDYIYGGYSLNTTATPIEIAGGRIVGDIMDPYSEEGFSPVTVSGDFTSEGDFLVSDFTVASGGVFNLDDGNMVQSHNGVHVDGTFNVVGTNADINSDMTVNNNGEFTIDEDITVSGEFTNNGRTNIATGRQLTVDTMAAGTGDLHFGFNTANDAAQLVVTGGAANLTGQTLHIDVTGTTGLSDYAHVLLVDSNGAIIGGPGGTRTAVDDDSVLWEFLVVDGTDSLINTDASHLYLISSQASSVGLLAATQNNENVGNVLMTQQSTTDPQLAAVVASMNGASTQEEFNEVLEATQAPADAAEPTIMSDFTRNTMDTAGLRLQQLRLQDIQRKGGTTSLQQQDQFIPEMKGFQTWAVSFGDTSGASRNHGLAQEKWQQTGHQFVGGFGSYTRQDRRSGIDGFDAVSGGAIFGIDTATSFDEKVFGLAFSYLHAEVESNNANRAENNIDGFQIMGYMAQSIGRDAYAEFMASYARNDNSTKRHDVGGVPGLTAKGDFVSQETGAKAAIGRHIAYKDYLLTQSFSLDWLHYMADDYTETGAGGAGLSVSTKNLDSIEIGTGLRAERRFKREDGNVIIPEVHAGYYYDMAGDALQKSSSFIGGGASFATESPDPARHRANLGFGVTYQAAPDWDYTFSYDLDLKSGYQDHNLVAKAAWKF